jgi:hypothetical protein
MHFTPEGGRLPSGNGISRKGRESLSGGPGGARTPNPRFRRPMLYPVELRGREINVANVHEAPGLAQAWTAEAAVATWAQAEGGCTHKTLRQTNKNGVGNGNRTRNRRSHSPVLCQLSYSHRRNFIIATGGEKGRHRHRGEQPRRWSSRASPVAPVFAQDWTGEAPVAT